MQLSVHGSAVCIDNYGILIIGPSSIGKTELVIELISRGHQLIADDYLIIEKKDELGENLLVSTTKDSIGYLHIRGIGFIHIKQICNNFTGIKTSSKLDLVIELSYDSNLLNQDPIAPLLQQEVFFDICVPKFILPIGRNRNLALLSEIIVKHYVKQLSQGPNLDFINKFSSI